MNQTTPAPKPTLSELHVAALEALNVVANCKPGRCDLPPAERRAKRDAAAETVLAFVRAKTRSKAWAAAQDQVLASLGDHV